jgi:hypothetical protein
VRPYAKGVVKGGVGAVSDAHQQGEDAARARVKPRDPTNNAN